MNSNDLPLFLCVKDLATLMGIGKNQAYDLTHQPGFPVVRLGRRIVVPRDELFNWINLQVDSKALDA